MSRPYGWQTLYEAAVLETDFSKMQDRIAKAEQAIQQRLSDSPPPIIDEAELRAIGTTLGAVAVLKTQSANGASQNRHPQAPPQQKQAAESV